jgi:hypothetical protein
MTEEPVPGARVRATTKHGFVTVDELAEIQPGTARLMDELSRRTWVLYYAAKEGNWDLARYMTRESEKILQILSKVRPKYAEDLEAFRRDHLVLILQAVEAKDWSRFDSLFRAAIAASDVYHAKYNKGFIRFRLPERPPEWLDLRAR